MKYTLFADHAIIHVGKHVNVKVDLDVVPVLNKFTRWHICTTTKVPVSQQGTHNISMLVIAYYYHFKFVPKPTKELFTIKDYDYTKKNIAAHVSYLQDSGNFMT